MRRFVEGYLRYYWPTPDDLLEASHDDGSPRSSSSATPPASHASTTPARAGGKRARDDATIDAAMDASHKRQVVRAGIAAA